MVRGSTISNFVENVLILQGGGSLGAFGCGVFKALANNNIKIDIIAGTSIGGVNAAIISGSKQKDHPEEALEQYWLELAEGSTSSYGGNLAPYVPPVEDRKLTRISQAKSTCLSMIQQFMVIRRSLYQGGNQNTALQIRSTLHLIIGHIYMTIHLW
ncbi:MAG: patatin-like phospholipase family protein [Nitrososphaeraceae archaeon]